MSRTRSTSVKLKIPTGAQPGDTLELLVGGDSVFIEVPKDAKPGETRVVTAELPEFAQPAKPNAYGHVPSPPPRDRPVSAHSENHSVKSGSVIGKDSDMIWLLGGGVCACCNDWQICCLGTFCHSYLQARALRDANQGSMVMNFLFSVCEFSGGVFCLAQRVDSLNTSWGGQPGFVRRVFCHLCCARCAACQLARAVKKAKELGLLSSGNQLALSTHSGAPPLDAMLR